MSLFRPNSMPAKLRPYFESRIEKNLMASFDRICKENGAYVQLSRLVAGLNLSKIAPEILNIRLVGFFTSLGTDLGKRGLSMGAINQIRDSVDVFRVVLQIEPTHYPARLSLAYSLSLLGNTNEASLEAKTTINDMENAKKIQDGLNIPIPTEFRISDDQLKETRNMLNEIINAYRNGK